MIAWLLVGVLAFALLEVSWELRKAKRTAWRLALQLVDARQLAEAAEARHSAGMD